MTTRLIFILFVFISCSSQNAEVERLNIENNQLKEEVQRLVAQTENFQYWENNTEVSLANTTLRELSSKFNGQTYQLKISYPKTYRENPDERYPVLYVLDAETNFGGISYIVQRLIKDKLIPPILVVGIAYGTDYASFYELRSRDLTPVEDKDLRMGGKIDPTGGAPLFSDFIEFELFPFIEENFKVQADDRAIYGHSYGGLYACYALMRKPHLFNRYILLSPSLWYKDELLVQQLETLSLALPQTDLYMASGEFEGRIDDLQIEFVSLLEKQSLKNLELKSEVIANETHRTIFGVGFTNGLRYIYQE